LCVNRPTHRIHEAYITNLAEDLPVTAPQQALYFFFEPHGQALFLEIFCNGGRQRNRCHLEQAPYKGKQFLIFIIYIKNLVIWLGTTITMTSFNTITGGIFQIGLLYGFFIMLLTVSIYTNTWTSSGILKSE
jgi:hypothetical protein